MAGVGLWRTRPDGGRSVLLEGVDWRVAEGERWALLGPNGAGKTTLLSIAATRRFPSEGSVSVLGHRLGAVDLSRLRPDIGHVDGGRAPAFPGTTTTADAVLAGAAGTIVVRPELVAPGDRERAAGLLELFGCAHLAERPLRLLSRGEHRRALLARALMARPRLLLLDEPTSGLDLPARERFLGALDELVAREPRLAVVQVSHHLEELAASTGHALLLRGGRVVAAGPAESVLAAPALSRCFGAPLRLVSAAGRRMAVLEGVIEDRPTD